MDLTNCFFSLEVSEEGYLSFKGYFSPIFSLLFNKGTSNLQILNLLYCKAFERQDLIINFWGERAILSVDDRMDQIVISHLGYEFSVPHFNGLE